MSPTTRGAANQRCERGFVFDSVGLATSLLEALVDDLGQELVDVAFAHEDQPRAHDEQVVEGAQWLREIQLAVAHAFDHTHGERVALAFGLVK